MFIRLNYGQRVYCDIDIHHLYVRISMHTHAFILFTIPTDLIDPYPVEHFVAHC
jgi:hypothetical protein